MPTSPHEKRCKIACTPPELAPCEKQDRNACIAKCVEKLVELSDECASCLVTASRWSGSYCSGCSACTFTSGGKSPACEGNGVPEGETPTCCKPEDESCTFKMPGPAEGTCRTTCLK